MGGLTSEEAGGLIFRIVFLLAGRWAYIQGLIKELEGGGGIYIFCEHFESYMVVALRSYSNKRGISLHSLSVSICALHTCQ